MSEHTTDRTDKESVVELLEVIFSLFLLTERKRIQQIERERNSVVVRCNCLPSPWICV